ncbi:hypothetical protein [Nostoc sp. 'Lobaria pulmonaria (5183) cyanobiont']|uniref:hypothetical protein n=1 Tax=Nostoc sp. 'Lobaria pulmonaria (5183) cyanobiont' TaxID=1618022 RepID=UPI00131A4830|nr:hypothetical protein [Nostoc sp. 'Lobaria pulmonaria (5183) cyanobiont']
MPIGLFCLVYEVAIAHRRCFTSGTECIHLPQPDLLAIAKRHERVICQTAKSVSMGVAWKAQFQPKNCTFSRRGSVQIN